KLSRHNLNLNSFPTRRSSDLIEVTDCLGLDNTANNYNFEVFPVPANEVLNLVFSMEQGQNLEVKLYSMDAKVVYSTNIVSNNVKDRKSTRLNSSHVKISYAVF